MPFGPWPGESGGGGGGVASVGVIAPITKAGTATNPIIGLNVAGDGSLVVSAGALTRGPLAEDVDANPADPNVKVVAFHETGGPTQLTFGAVPDEGAGNDAFLVRPGGTDTVIGRSEGAALAHAPIDLIFTYGGPDLSVGFPSFFDAGDALPNFWLRPMSYFLEATPSDFAAQDQVWEYPVLASYNSAILDVFVYQVGLTGTGTNIENMIITPTHNGADIVAGQITTAQNETNVSHSSSWNLAVTAFDMIGIRISIVDGVGSAYDSGAFRAVFHLRLFP
jgi:hypothetical protein